MAYSFTQQNIQFSAPSINTWQKYLWTGNINQDGVLDFILQTKASVNNGLTTLRIETSTATTYVETKLLVNGSEFQVQNPEVLIADFTGDGLLDLAVFDAGIYDWGVRLNLGLTPQLFVGNGKGNFVASTAFLDAIQKVIVPIPSNGNLGGIQTDTTIGIKDVAFADINHDGLMDIWVECTGSKNMTSHFLINHGTYFDVDINNRISKTLFFGPASTDYFRYGMGEFLDINSDSSPDLFLGQIRDNDLTHINQTSLLLINDGSGYYPANKAIKLPNPNFYYGYTSVQGVDSFDINRDGLKDLVIAHTRNDDVSGPLVETAWTGSYFQVLIQTADGQFFDQTQAYLPDQSAWSATTNQPAKGITHADLNNDGWNDLVIDYAGYKSNTQLPVYFLNQGGSRLTVGDPNLIYGSIPLAFNLKAINANNDQYLDFYKVQSVNSTGLNTITMVIGSAQVDANTNSENEKNGSIYDDVLTGTNLNDLIYGNEGADRIDGGSGIDTARYDGLSSQYALSSSSGALVVVDKKGASGTDTLTNVERLKFADTNVALDVGPTQNAGSVYMLYKAAFNRAPDNGGMGYWLAQKDGGSDIVTNIAQGFVGSKEFTDKYGANPSNASYVDKLYQNVLGRAGDSGGITYWNQELDAGRISKAAVLVQFATLAEGAANVAPTIAHGIAYTQWVG